MHDAKKGTESRALKKKWFEDLMQNGYWENAGTSPQCEALNGSHFEAVRMLRKLTLRKQQNNPPFRRREINTPLLLLFELQTRSSPRHFSLQANMK